ncbi:MAG: DUF599 domain-containing protein [Casimicrobiaceae bacterium]
MAVLQFHWGDTLYELAWLLASAIAVVVYERAQRGKATDEEHMPNLRGWQARVRAQWVTTLMRTGKQEILGVQTLRNSVMAASFMASLSGLAIPGALTLSADVSRLAIEWHRELGLPFAASLQPVKSVLLLAIFFAAFVMFVQAIRLYNHVGYMIALPLDAPFAVQPDEVARYLNRAGRSFTNGIRIFFACLPAAAWLIDVHLLAASTVILLLILRDFDKRA